MELNENLQVEMPADPNADAKAALEAVGISAEVAAFIFDEKGNRLVNVEAIEVGDTIKIEGISAKVDILTIESKDSDGNATTRTQPYVSVVTSGDRDVISLNRLIGTSKEKYFAPGRNAQHIDYDAAKVLRLPRRPAQAAALLATELKGKSYRLVEIAEECGREKDRTYYRFVEV